MERRNFLKLFTGAVAGIALEQAIPFNRVWSFPKKIVYAGVDFGLEPDFTVVTLYQMFREDDIVSFAGIPGHYRVINVQSNALNLIPAFHQARRRFPS